MREEELDDLYWKKYWDEQDKEDQMWADRANEKWYFEEEEGNIPDVVTDVVNEQEGPRSQPIDMMQQGTVCSQLI